MDGTFRNVIAPTNRPPEQVLVVLPCVAAERCAVLGGAHGDAVLVVDVHDRGRRLAGGEAQQAVEARAAQRIGVVPGAVEAVLAHASGYLDGHRDRQLEVTGAIAAGVDLREDRRPLAHVDLVPRAEVLRVAIAVVGADLALVLAVVTGGLGQAVRRAVAVEIAPQALARAANAATGARVLVAERIAAAPPWCHTPPA